MKLEYHLHLIENEWKIQFKNFELRTSANLRVIWNTFCCYETKCVIEVDATIVKSIEYIMKMLKHPSRC